VFEGIGRPRYYRAKVLIRLIEFESEKRKSVNVVL